MKWLYFSLGWLFFLLGALGVMLPVLPTTPFMLLALWAFSRSSPRFHHWLYTHKLFGPPLQQWDKYRVIPLTAKLVALPVMAFSLYYLFAFSSVHQGVKIAACGLILFGVFFILSKPSKPPE